MFDQGTFDFTAKPAAPVGEVECLVAYLLKRGMQWTPASQILSDLGINDRKLRNLKSQSANRIISGPGCPGYRHINCCTLSDIHEAAERRHSQARAMIADYIALKRLAHSLIR